MKTPRDLLLERHRDQSPALDQLRQRVIAQELGADTAAVRQGRTGFPAPVPERTEMVAQVRAQTAQLVLASSSNEVGAGASGIPSTIGPSPAPAGDRLQACPTLLARVIRWLNWQRAAWSGFAAVWCLILGLNLAARHEFEHAVVAAKFPAITGEFLAGLRENRAQLTALLNDRSGDYPRTAGGELKPAPRGDAIRPRKDASHLDTAFA